MNEHAAPSGFTMPCTGPTCVMCRRLDRSDPGYSAAYRRLFFPAEFPDEPAPQSAPRTTPPPPSNVHAERHELILACDYRIPAERGSGCGCQLSTACLLGRGKWADRPAEVGYDDCLACVGG